MIKIEWFDEKIINDYVGLDNGIKEYTPRINSIVPKIENDLKNSISSFPNDLANLFTENGIVSTKKIQEFLKLNINQIEKEPALKAYIERCSLVSKLLNDINKQSYDKWFKQNSNKVINNYLDEKFYEYNIKYPTYPLIYPPKATAIKWSKDLKKEIVKSVLYEPYGSVFDYNKIDDKTRHTLMDSLNIPVCPFCNRQYITSLDDMKKGQKRSTADLDHFFPKSDYPLFALSLFNFVPSCQVCNSRMKSDNFMDDDGIRPIYPYEERFDDSVVFQASASNVKDAKELLMIWLGERKDNLKIELDYGKKDDGAELTEYQKHVKRSIELYHLEEVYQAHKNYVSDLMLKKRIYDDGEYLKGLKNIFENLNPETFGNDSDEMKYVIINSDICLSHKQLEAFLYGYNWDKGQDKTRPLSKLAYDIIKR